MAVVKTKNRITAVNAAFLQEVKDSNIELWSTLRELRGFKYREEESAEQGRKLVDLLGELRDSLAFEFSLEETYGFVDGATCPVATVADVERIQQQHRELYLHLQELCEQAEEAQYRGTIQRDFAIYLESFEQFDIHFDDHERYEAELIAGTLVQRQLSR